MNKCIFLRIVRACVTGPSGTNASAESRLTGLSSPDASLQSFVEVSLKLPALATYGNAEIYVVQPLMACFYFIYLLFSVLL